MTLAIIAGEGQLPAMVAAQADAPIIACLEGFAPDYLSVDLRFRLETLGSFLLNLGARGVTEVCFAGAIRRPQIDPTKIDAATAPLVPIIAQALQSGDDSALRAILDLFEKAGFSIKAAHDIVPDLMPRPQVMGVITPQDEADAARAEDIQRALADVDVGQACIVARGQALALETVAGTDWMIRSLLRHAEDRERDWVSDIFHDLTGDAFRGSRLPERDPALPEGGLLFKGIKPQQDRRVDMPTISGRTIALAAEAGLRGVVIEAGAVQVLEFMEAKRIAELTGLFLWVREAGA